MTDTRRTSRGASAGRLAEADLSGECPSETLLAQHVSASLGADAAEAIEVHIDRCDRCRTLLSVLALAATLDARAPGSAASFVQLSPPARDPTVIEVGAVLAGRFAVESIAAVGGMGVIYRAHDKNSGETVAVKVMQTMTLHQIEQFEREAQILAELRHAGIVRYVSHGRVEPDGLFLAMEWLDGEDLARLLARRRLTVSESLEAVEGVARALSAAHARGIIHRDIKPSNVFLRGGSVSDVRLLDFGLADAARSDARLRSMVVGTPGYMAPEQARGSPDVDARADVFALGCILFECITMKPAFVANRAQALLGKIAVEDPPRMSDVKMTESIPAVLDEFVAKMLSKHPNARPADAAAVGTELAAIRAALPASGAPVEGVPRERDGSLTARELRVASAIVCTAGDAALNGPLAPTAPGRGAVAAFGGRVESLVDGTLLVTFTGAGLATDQAVRAARSALELRRFLPRAPLALSSGRTNEAADGWVGDAIDRASALAALDPPALGEQGFGARIDAATASLLGARFEIVTREGGAVLVAEREVEATRTLLGRPTPCVGRDAELDELERAAAEAFAGRARAIVVRGPAGGGKSRLRHELVGRLPGARAQVWSGWGDPLRAGSAFALAGDLLRRWADLRAGEPLAARQDKVRARVARHVRPRERLRVSEFVGEIAGSRFADDDSVQLRAARLDPLLMNDQIRRAWLDLVEAETEDAPLAIVLEDLHWGDLPTIALIDDVLRVHAARPFLVVAFARPEVSELFGELWSERETRTLVLAPLSPLAAGALVQAVLGEATDPALTQRLVERAAGNAFFLEELLRAHVESPDDATPETIVAMTQARLEALPRRERLILRAASVFGSSFSEGGVRALVADGAVAVADGLAELTQRELVARSGSSRFDGEQEISFRHDLVREAAYSMLVDDDRTVGHRLAAAWLERAGEDDAVVMAEHCARGDEPERAAAWFRRGAEEALEGNDLAAALARSDRALEMGVSGPARGELRRIQADAHRWGGDNASAHRCSSEALDLIAAGESGWFDAARTAAVSAGNLGLVGEVAVVVRRLREVMRGGSPSEAAAIAAAQAGTELFGAGMYASAADFLDEAERALPPALARAPLVRSNLEHARAIQAFIVGDPGEYIDRMREAADAAEHAGDLRTAARARQNLGFGYLCIGLLAEAEACLREVLVVADRMALSHVASLARHNLGMALALRGRLEEATELEAATADEFCRQGHKRLEASCRDYLACILLQAAQPDRAEREARRSVELMRDASPTRAPRAMSVLARALLAQGRHAEALAASTEAIECAAGLGWIPEEPMIRLVHAEALEAAGRVNEAREEILAAKNRLLAAADRIKNPLFRASFLDKVADHARIMERGG